MCNNLFKEITIMLRSRMICRVRLSPVNVDAPGVACNNERKAYTWNDSIQLILRAESKLSHDSATGPGSIGINRRKTFSTKDLASFYVYP